MRKFRLSIKDIRRLVNLLLAAKEYIYSPGKIVAKLRSIKRLENKENKLKSSCEMLSKKEDRYKDIIPFTEEIASLGIGTNDLLALKVGIKEAGKHYNLPPFPATVQQT